MPREETLFFHDIRNAGHRILSLTQDKTFVQFIDNADNYEAVLYNLIVIGEAVRMLPEEWKQSYPSTPWREFVAFRNLMVHHYFGIDEEIVWSIVQDNLPELLTIVESELSKRK